MSESKEYILGPEALDFLRDNRITYGHTLSQLLLEVLDLHQGKITTFLPIDVRPEQLYDFEAGGVLPFPEKSTWRYITEQSGKKTILTPIPRDDSFVLTLIREFLCSDKNNVCIIEEPLAKPTDSSMSRRKTPYIIYGNEVYHFLSSRVGEAEIAEAIKWPHTTVSFLAILTTLVQNIALINKQKISADELRVLARGTETLMIGAYDGEGYLIWRKKSPLVS
jgi:hypothetical protein